MIIVTVNSRYGGDYGSTITMKLEYVEPTSDDAEANRKEVEFAHRFVRHDFESNVTVSFPERVIHVGWSRVLPLKERIRIALFKLYDRTVKIVFYAPSKERGYKIFSPFKDGLLARVRNALWPPKASESYIQMAQLAYAHLYMSPSYRNQELQFEEYDLRARVEMIVWSSDMTELYLQDIEITVL